MRAPSFFGGDTGLSYDDLKRRQQYAEAMQMRGASARPKTALDGINSAAQSILGGLLSKRLGEQEAKERQSATDAFNALFGGGAPATAMTPFSAAPSASDGASGGLTAGIIETANAIGADPLDLATAISYETAGTFDPMKAGPTTQWGQHRGLIQFGEPQAQQHGVDFSSREAAIASQLGADGAIASYFRDAGFEPGMSGLDLYSTINAGAPGRYNASDANNGGAPGSVADKWNNQMEAHRQKAAALLGGSYTPQQSHPRTGGVDPAMLQLMGNPYLNQGQRSALGMLMQQQMQANAPMTPMQQAQMLKLQMEMDAMQQPGPRERVQDANGRWRYLDDGSFVFADVETPEGFRPLSADEMASLGLPEGNYQVGPDGRIYSIGGGGVNITNNMGANVQPLGTRGQILVPDATEPSGVRVEIAPGSELDAERRKAAETQGVADANTRRSGDVVIEDIDRVLDMTTNGGIPTTGGIGAVASRIPGTEAHDVSKLLDTIQANVGFDRLQQMRDASPTGGALGAVSQSEMTLLNSALGSLAQSQSKEQFVQNLERLKQIYTTIVHGAGGAPDQGAQPREMTFQQFAADPQAKAAAEKYGVTLEEMWAIKQGQK